MPYEMTRRFEAALCEYTGAKYAVAVNSCTAALLLTVAWHVHKLPPHKVFDDNVGIFEPMWTTAKHRIEIPKHTYMSVPMSIIHAGARPTFRDETWRGGYRLAPLPVWDCARRFTSGMYIPEQFQCVSFATSKILGIEQGGAILHDTAEADKWFRRMRFDGRTEGVDPLYDTFDLIGHHVIMPPSIAAQLLLKLHHLPKHNEDMPHYPYPDLSLFKVFQ